MRSSKVLYGIKAKDMPDGFKQGLQMQLDGAKKRLSIIMQQGFMDRDEKLVYDVNNAIEWCNKKLNELEMR